MSVLYRVNATRAKDDETVWTFIEAGCADEAMEMALEVFGAGDVVTSSEPANDKEIREYIADLVMAYRNREEAIDVKEYPF